MELMQEEQLKSILMYYVEHFEVDENEIPAIISDCDTSFDLIVTDNSFFAPIRCNEQVMLLAGTKAHADRWVLKKIIKLIKSGVPILTYLNGNLEKILPMLDKYSPTMVNKQTFIFNNKKGLKWQH